MQEQKLLKRITFNPGIFGGKPIIRGRRLAVEHILGMLAAGDSVADLLNACPWLEKEDIQACIEFLCNICVNRANVVLSFRGIEESFAYAGERFLDSSE